MSGQSGPVSEWLSRFVGSPICPTVAAQLAAETVHGIGFVAAATKLNRTIHGPATLCYVSPRRRAVQLKCRLWKALPSGADRLRPVSEAPGSNWTPGLYYYSRPKREKAQPATSPDRRNPVASSPRGRTLRGEPTRCQSKAKSGGKTITTMAAQAAYTGM